MKKIIVALFSLVVLFGARNAFASVTWNQASNDCSTISVANATTTEGFQTPCWTGKSIYAAPSDVINIRMYYHNTGNQTATNVHVMVDPGALNTSSTTKNFTGRVTSDQDSTTVGPVTASISSAQTLTFLSAKWYTNNNAETLTPLLYGQTGAEVLTDMGLNIGSIAPGWSTQGSVVVAFKVSAKMQALLCQDPNATNYGGTLPCTYPPQICNDPTANNFGGPLPCTYINNKVTTGTITAVPQSCLIPIGSSSCTTRLNWTTVNPVGISAVTNPVLGTVATGNTGNRQTTVSFGNQTFYLYNNSILLDQTSVSASCSAWSTWDGSTCSTNQVYNNCTISNFTPNIYNVSSGSPVTITWSTQNCTSVNVSGPGLNSSYASGSQVVYPTGYSNVYMITAYGQGGSPVTQQFTVTTNQQQIYTPPVIISNSCAVTTVATNVSETGAQVNGLVSSTSQYTGSAHFEYGPTVSLGMQTTPRSLNGLSTFTEFLSGLTPNTIYYFRFVSDCNGSQSFGSTEVFSTSGPTIINNGGHTTIIRQGRTVIGTESPIQLSIEDRYQSIGVGDIIDYTVTYRNIGRALLTNPILQVIAPTGITIINTSRGTYSAATNTLTVQLEDLPPQAGGRVYLQGRVDSLPIGTAQIVTTAVLVYTSPNGAQENAIAYVLNRPKDLTQSALGASAFFAGWFFPGTLIGWLLLLILILLIILLARRYGNSNSMGNNSTHVSYGNVPPPPAHH